MLTKRRFIFTLQWQGETLSSGNDPRRHDGATASRPYHNHTPTAISAGDLSAAGFLKEKANRTPMKQRAAPAKNGV